VQPVIAVHVSHDVRMSQQLGNAARLLDELLHLGTSLGTPTARINPILSAGWGSKDAFAGSWAVPTQILTWGPDLELKRGRFAAPFWSQSSAPSKDLSGNRPGPRKRGFWCHGPPTRG
jgi:hypothetical protein